MTNTKTCTKCKLSKPLTEFTKVNTPQEYKSRCKSCTNEYERDLLARIKISDPIRYAKKIKSITTRIVEFRKRQPASQTKYYLKHHYNLTIEQLEDMKIAQNNQCAICGINPKDNLVVDHNHITGKVRGLLCSSCNKGLGFFKDNIQRLQSAIVYLQ